MCCKWKIPTPTSLGATVKKLHGLPFRLQVLLRQDRGGTRVAEATTASLFHVLPQPASPHSFSVRHILKTEGSTYSTVTAKVKEENKKMYPLEALARVHQARPKNWKRDEKQWVHDFLF